MIQPYLDSRIDALEMSDAVLPVTVLSLGNPHCVVWRENLDGLPLVELGPQIENHAAFPNRTNVQFAAGAGLGARCRPHLGLR